MLLSLISTPLEGRGPQHIAFMDPQKRETEASFLCSGGGSAPPSPPPVPPGGKAWAQASPWGRVEGGVRARSAQAFRVPGSRVAGSDFP